MRFRSTLPPCPSLLLILSLFATELLSASIALAQATKQELPAPGQSLTDVQAAQLAKLALSGLHREFPNKPNHVVTSPENNLGPKQLHPRIVGNKPLEELVVARAREYYSKDRDYNSEYEPSGEDFFSPSLNEADLMRRVLAPNEFASWLTRFLPDLKPSSKSKLLEPVLVSDVTDGKLVHLAGLDLSRAWCMLGITSGLPKEDARVSLLLESAKEHAKVGFGYVFSGHYEGEHWLGTFAVYALTSE